MNPLAPQLVEDGLALLIEALDGDGIQFTRIVIGNGTSPEDPKKVKAVANPIIEIGIIGMEKHENFVVLTGKYDNSELENGFYMNELGVYAQNTAGKEVLYAYHHSEANVDYIPDKESGRVVETQIGVIVSIGTADKVTAILIEAAAYASKQEFQNHLNDSRNPHNVTASDVGLGNVKNVELKNDVVDFTEAKTAANIEPSDNIGVILGKIKKIFTDYLAHLKADNPHKLTIDILNKTKGTLGIERGGTGGNTSVAARKALGLNSIYATKSYTSAVVNFKAGEYVQGNVAIEALVGYTAVAISQWQILNDGTSGSSDGSIDLNNLCFSGNSVAFHLINRKSSANHCKFWITVLYIKNL